LQSVLRGWPLFPLDVKLRDLQIVKSVFLKLRIAGVDKRPA